MKILFRIVFGFEVLYRCRNFYWFLPAPELVLVQCSSSQHATTAATKSSGIPRDSRSCFISSAAETGGIVVRRSLIRSSFAIVPVKSACNQNISGFHIAADECRKRFFKSISAG